MQRTVLLVWPETPQLAEHFCHSPIHHLTQAGERGNSLSANGLPVIKNSYNYCSANAAHGNMFSTAPLTERMINFTVFTCFCRDVTAGVFENAENNEALMDKIRSGGEADTPYVMFYKLLL